MNTLFPQLTLSPADITARLLPAVRRVLLLGQPGSGKSTLTAALGAQLAAEGETAYCLTADPGTPAFGVPGALAVGEWQESGWQLLALEPLCTLNAARFRLPLIAAVSRLAARVPPSACLLLDTPGVVRGAAGAELLPALVQAGHIDGVLVLTRDSESLPLVAELRALSLPVWQIPAAADAARPGQGARNKARTALWEAYLADSQMHEVPLANLNLTGTPPPRDVPTAWQGRQIALWGEQKVMGEVVAFDGDSLQLRLPDFGVSNLSLTSAPQRARDNVNFVTPQGFHTLLVRDAVRDNKGYLTTAKPFGDKTVAWPPPTDVRPFQAAADDEPRPVVRTGAVTAILLNGVFGDPLLHVRLHQRKRSLLFDLGDAGRLPAHVAHQVSDVFISHAHFDHIGGFLWLLRSRMNEITVCRLTGPPGLAAHISGFLNAILWDRIEDHGPRFEVAELHGEQLQRFALQAGRAAPVPLESQALTDGIVLSDLEFRVRAVMLDHGTPVLAYAFEPKKQLNVRKERLLASGFMPGPWLNELKIRVAGEDWDTRILLPDGSETTVAELAADLLLIQPGAKLVYATDFADTTDNRARVLPLAHNAHTLFCEAGFSAAHHQQAARTGHLTARACGEIATAAQVTHLVPFHFSRRYEDNPDAIYSEVAAYCSRMVRWG